MNQPPQTEKQTGKRIVSKGEYVASVSRKLCLKFMGLGLLLSAIVGLVALWWNIHKTPANSFSAMDFLFAFLGMTGYICLVGVGDFIGKKAARIDPGIPITRANTADLPAPDSLVRASEEPLHEQQAVLLRGARQEQETPPEQLVRATAGPEPL